MKWSVRDKIKEIERELSYRRFVYAKRVEGRSMTREAADRQIEILCEILADYRAMEAKERLL